MSTALHAAISTYIEWLGKSTWVRYEVYKFEFAHEVAAAVDFARQSDEEVLSTLAEKLNQRYSETSGRGVNFLQSAVQYNSGQFLTLSEIAALRQLREIPFEDVTWEKGVATYNAFTCWSAILFPGANFPIYASNHEALLAALFPDEQPAVGHQGVDYVKACQPYLERIAEALTSSGAMDAFRTRAAAYYRDEHANKLPYAYDPSAHLTRLDRNYLTEDFLHFTSCFESYKHTAFEDWERDVAARPDGVLEGARRLVMHVQRERNSGFAQQAKARYIAEHPGAPCEACGQSMGKVYPGVGKNYLEAHHVAPLGTRTVETITEKSDFNFLCANCHRMIHRMDMPLLESLREVIAQRGSMPS